jgi:hypothetical protein
VRSIFGLLREELDGGGLVPDAEDWGHVDDAQVALLDQG